MTEKIELKGYWFLPDVKENTLPGVLTFNPSDTIILELFGNFLNLKKDSLEEILKLHYFSAINGTDSTGRKITLLDVYIKISHYNADTEFCVTSCKAQYLILGVHFLSKNEHLFKKIRVGYDILTGWLSPSLIKRDFDKKVVLPCYYIQNKSEIIEEILIDSENKITLKREANVNETTALQSVVFTQYTSLEIEKIGLKTSLIELLDKADLFKQFLSFGALKPAKFSFIEIIDLENYEEIEKGKRVSKKASSFFAMQQLIFSFLELKLPIVHN